MTVKHIDIGRDFSEKLGPRYENLGPFSGELFYRTLLHPAYLENDLVVVSLDSFKNLSASFFEEAFGGLVRDHGLPEVEQKLKFDTARLPCSNDPSLDARGRRASEEGEAEVGGPTSE